LAPGLVKLLNLIKRPQLRQAIKRNQGPWAKDEKYKLDSLIGVNWEEASPGEKKFGTIMFKKDNLMTLVSL